MLIWILLSGLASVILLVPIGYKWKLPLYLVLPATFVTGCTAALITYGITAGMPGMGELGATVVNLCLIVLLPSSLLIWKFYRDPERIVSQDPGIICSPADGTVIYAKYVGPESIPASIKNEVTYSLLDFAQPASLPKEAFIIGISMNFLDVHVNRAPIEGKVTHVRLLKGSHLSLRRREALTMNERALTVINNGKYSIAVVQIASRLVRAIVSYVAEGASVHKGQRIGMIRFGSQVDLLVPKLPSLQLEVKCGQKLRAGASIIARVG